MPREEREFRGQSEDVIREDESSEDVRKEESMC